MGVFYAVDSAFWTDSDVVDNFTPEDKFFYLYLLTSPHANLSGCYELSLKQASDEIGYSKDSVERLIDRFISVHKMIDYDKETKEVLIIKWGRHHWTSSEKYLKALKKKIDGIKSQKFRSYLRALFESFSSKDEDSDMVWIGYTYHMDTSYIYPISLYPKSNSNIDRDGGMGEEKEKKEDIGKEADDVVRFWNGTRLPQVVRVRPDSERGKMLRARLKEFGFDDVVKAVNIAADSDYLQDQHWFDFGWFVRPENFVKVLEGKYNRDVGSNQHNRNGRVVGESQKFRGIEYSLDPERDQ